MEISRQLKAGFNVQAEAPAQARVEPAEQPKTTLSSSASAPRPGLEALQQAMRSLPNVDLAKVAIIKLALQRGEFSSDNTALASSMLSYHSGSDA